MAEVAPASVLPRGSKLGSTYEVGKVLGRGGFGITYLAKDVVLGRRVAIKEYMPGAIARRADSTMVRPLKASYQDPFSNGLRKFVHEGRVLASFKHPNIVAVHRLFKCNGTAYMVLEYETGATLGECLKSAGRPFTEDEIRSVVAPLLDGLSYVHDHSYLHRDIKPSNIFVRTDGTPVIIDFGTARQTSLIQSTGISVFVSGHYTPPEQFDRHGNQGPWTDIYSLAVTLYELISYTRPPAAIERTRAYRKRLPDPLVPAAEIGKGRYNRALLAAIDWGLEVDETRRPRTIGEWRDALMGQSLDVGTLVQSLLSTFGGMVRVARDRLGPQ